MRRAHLRRRWLLTGGGILAFFACGWALGAAGSSLAKTFVRLEDTVGALVSVPTVNLEGEAEGLRLGGDGESVIVFALSPECPFCAQNMSRWRRLIEAVGPDTSVARFVVLSTGEPSQARRFLTEHDLDAPLWTIDEPTLELLGVPAVPATIVVDSSNRRVLRWIGVLDDDLEGDLARWIREGAYATH
ncbi:MAG: hypothetical protein PVI01_04325 [Gemmatimonadales bacterium]|jgi:hypothetical protein